MRISTLVGALACFLIDDVLNMVFTLNMKDLFA